MRIVFYSNMDNKENKMTHNAKEELIDTIRNLVIREAEIRGDKQQHLATVIYQHQPSFYDAVLREIFVAKATPPLSFFEYAKGALESHYTLKQGNSRTIQQIAQVLLPGIRISDSDSVVAHYVYNNGVLPQDFIDQMIRENRVSGQQKKAEEKKPEQGEASFDYSLFDITSMDGSGKPPYSISLAPKGREQAFLNANYKKGFVANDLYILEDLNGAGGEAFVDKKIGNKHVLTKFGKDHQSHDLFRLVELKAVDLYSTSEGKKCRLTKEGKSALTAANKEEEKLIKALPKTNLKETKQQKINRRRQNLSKEVVEALARKPLEDLEEQRRMLQLEDKAMIENLSDHEMEQLGKIRKKPLSPRISIALSPSKKYSFYVKYNVVDLFILETSHTPEGHKNPKYDQRLQSRQRGSFVDQLQIQQLASALEPMALLYDSRRTDDGSPIIGEDNMVESGNGRTMALMLAARKNSDKWRLYQKELKEELSSFGISERELDGLEYPVLVRERLTGDGNLDFRVEFAEMANTSSIKRMSAYEEALKDSRKIDPEMLDGLEIGEEESIDAALLRKKNIPVIQRYFDSMPATESASLMDAKGDPSKHGRERFKAALYLYAFPGTEGQSLTKKFVETTDHDIKNFDNAFSKSLAGLVKVRLMVDEGERHKTVLLTNDFAAAILKMEGLKSRGETVEKFLRMGSLFEIVTPLQKEIMRKFDELQKSVKKLTALINAYVQVAINTPDPRELMLGGFESHTPTPEQIWNWTLKRYENDQNPQPSLF